MAKWLQAGDSGVGLISVGGLISASSFGTVDFLHAVKMAITNSNVSHLLLRFILLSFDVMPNNIQ